MLRFTDLWLSCAFTHLIQMEIFFLGSHEYKQASCEKINVCVCCGQSTASYFLQQDIGRIWQLFSSQNHFYRKVTKMKSHGREGWQLKYICVQLEYVLQLLRWYWCIPVTVTESRAPNMVNFWAGHCLRQKLNLMLLEIIYSLNGSTVPNICPQDLKSKLHRQADCLATRWPMLVRWAHFMKSLMRVQM